MRFSSTPRRPHHHLLSRLGARWLPTLTVASVTTIALVGGVLQPVSFAAAAEKPASAAKATSAPKITEADTPIEARIAARAQGSRVEVLSERTESSQTFAEPSGLFTTESSTGIERVQDDKAKDGWRDVDLTLTEGSDGVIRPLSPVVPLEVHPGGEPDAPLVEVSSGDASLGFGWDGGVLPEPELDGNRATYEDVEPGVDLVVEATRYGFEHYLVLTEKPADVSDVKVELPIISDGLTLKQNPSADAVTVVDGKGKTVGQVGEAYMWDADTDPYAADADPAKSNALPVADVELQKTGGEQTLLVTPSEEFLEDATYPVTIDPGVSLNYAGPQDTFAASAYPSTNYASDTLLRIGTATAGTEKYRTFLRFTGQPISGKKIVSASLQLYGNQSYNCSAYPMTAYPANESITNGQITWNNQPAINTSEAVTITVAGKGGGTSCPAGWMTAGSVTSIVQYFADSNRDTFVISLRASETSSTGWKRVESSNGAHPPKLIVTYNRDTGVPATPTIVGAPVVGSYPFVKSAKPTVQSKATDPDGQTVSYEFQVFDANSATSEHLLQQCYVNNLVSDTLASCTLTTALTDNVTRWVRVGAHDAYMGHNTWSGMVAFKTALSAPPAPTVSCPGFAAGSWGANPPVADVSCTVTVAASTGNNATTALKITRDGQTVSNTIAASGGTVAVTVPKTAGGHTITAQTSQAAGNIASASYSFGYGPAAFTSAVNGVKTNNTVRLSVVSRPATSGTVSGKLQWRVAGDSSRAWQTVTNGDMGLTTNPTSDWAAPVAATSVDARVSNVIWPTANLNAGSSRVPVLLEVQFCFTYSTAPSAPLCTAVDGNQATILRVPHAFGGGFPTAEAGPGQVALWTGELNLSETDVTVPTPDGALSVSRSHSSFDGPLPAGYGVFGPGWTANFDGAGDGAAGYTVVDNTQVDGTIALIDDEGDPLVFHVPGAAKGDAPAGTYTAVDEDTAFSEAQLTVTGSGTARLLKLVEFDGTATTWKIPAVVTDPRFRWAPDTVAQPGALGTSTYTTDSTGRVTRILASVPDGVSCTTLTAGCRALDITYATLTTATATTPGDVKDQVKQIAYTAWDTALATPAMRTVPVATYTYFADKRLASVTDPRNSLGTSYTYETSGADVTRLASLTNSGQAAFGFEYATVDAGGVDLRLKKVTRGAWAAGKSTSALASYVYRIDPSVDGDGLPDLSAAKVGWWQQASTPTYGAAVFGPDHPVTAITPSGLTAADWKYASLQYTDAEGYTVNTAEYGAGAWQLTATDYDGTGNVVRAFDNRGLAEVIARHAALPDVEFDATEYASVTKYNPAQTIGGVEVTAGMFVTDTWAPAEDAILSDGTQQRVRAHTAYTYDEDAPGGGIDTVTGKRWGLVTTTTTGASVVASATTDPAATVPADIETTSISKTGYDPIDTASATDDTSGWRLGAPTSTTLVMGTTPNATADITVKARYDKTGGVVESRTPLSAGGDEATTVSIDYTAGTSSVAACGLKPAWAGLPCISMPAAHPAAGGDLPQTQITGYSFWLAPTVTVETSGTGGTAVTRTTTTVYDSSGRQTGTNTIVTGTVDAAAEPPVLTEYDASTGLVTKTKTVSGQDPTSGTEIGSTTTSYDSWGRATELVTTNLVGTDTVTTTATTTYVEPGQPGAGQVATVTDDKGTVTYTYDGIDANGNSEQRGLVTAMTVSDVGTYHAAYDDQAALTLQTAPGGIRQENTYDDLGRLTALTYEGQDTDPATGEVTIGEWMSWTRQYDFQGRVRSETAPPAAFADNTTAPTREYTYDKAGRLTTATDRSTGTCVTRAYTFDKQGNRTGQVTKTAAAGGACGTGTPVSKSWTYDLSSRALTANGGAAYGYDVLGRVTTLPAADTPNPAKGNITLGYFESDAPRAITQDGVTTAYTLDTQGRRLVETTTAASVLTDTVTRYYTDTSDNPSWVTETLTGQPTVTTRYTPSLAGGLGASVVAGVATLDVTDPHGDVITTIPVPDTGDADGVSGWAVFDEYGNPVTAGTSPVDTGAAQYGWLGSHERATTDTGLILMGARLYNPTTGRFLSLDPVPGGNENAYSYPNDPINSFDTTGEFDWWLAADIALLALSFVPGVGVAALAAKVVITTVRVVSAVSKIAKAAKVVKTVGSVLKTAARASKAKGSKLLAQGKSTIQKLSGKNRKSFSTGRSEPAGLTEQIALRSAKSSRGTTIIRKLGDPRLGRGWTKQQHVFRKSKGDVVIHNLRNRYTGRTMDYKFINSPIHVW